MASSSKLSAIDDQSQALVDIGRDVCLWHLADIPLALTNVRYRG